MSSWDDKIYGPESIPKRPDSENRRNRLDRRGAPGEHEWEHVVRSGSSMESDLYAGESRQHQQAKSTEREDWRDKLRRKYERKGLDFVWMANPSVMGQEFCRKALMYQNRTENVDFQGGFYKYYPTYDDMDDETLKGYFSWRTKVRQGLYEDSPLSFIFVHVYELLEKIGPKTPEEGFRQLLEIKRHYHTKDLDRYLDKWLADYVIYYDLGGKYADYAFRDLRARDSRVDAFYDPVAYEPEEVLKAVEDKSSYGIGKSAFVKKNRELTASVVKRVIIKASDFFEANKLGSFADMCCGSLDRRSYQIFENAVFYDYKRYKSFEYKVDPIRIYYCDDGLWSLQSVEAGSNDSKSVVLSELMHETDRLLRQAANYSSKLKKKSMPDSLEGLVKSAIKDEIIARRKAAQPVVKIDTGKLAGIRSDAAVTRDRLLEGEEDAWESVITETEDVKPEPETKSAAEPLVGADEAAESSRADSGEPIVEPTAGEDLGLSDDERKLMALLLEGKPYKDFLADRHIFASVIIESINEKLYDEFDDTVIDTDDSGDPELVEDYIDDLNELFGQK